MAGVQCGSYVLSCRHSPSAAMPALGLVAAFKSTVSLLTRNGAHEHLAFDATLIHTAPVLESSMISTLIIPRVGDRPVVLASFGAPAEDGATTQLRAADVVKHAAGPGLEPLVHRERTSDGPVLRPPSLRGTGFVGSRVSSRPFPPDICTSFSSNKTRIHHRERRSELIRTRTRRIFDERLHVMGAGCHRVRPTSRSSAEICRVSSGDDANVHEPLPRLSWLPPMQPMEDFPSRPEHCSPIKRARLSHTPAGDDEDEGVVRQIPIDIRTGRITILKQLFAQRYEAARAQGPDTLQSTCG